MGNLIKLIYLRYINLINYYPKNISKNNNKKLYSASAARGPE
nr:MAG TPA: hypothetical protein [Caudoviricetes sp.]